MMKGGQQIAAPSSQHKKWNCHEKAPALPRLFVRRQILVNGDNRGNQIISIP
jgi:hypothetical protein